MNNSGQNKLFEVVGWAEPAKPNSADTLGFTFVQPNLRDKMNGVFVSIPEVQE